VPHVSSSMTLPSLYANSKSTSFTRMPAMAVEC
jgi:hypothetical protein